jgi:Zn finger protein HypA/HybF involved in hydrogenase expression
MALPMNTQPTFNMVIPSTGKTVRFRPFVVKEEKALLIAQQSEDPTVMVDTLKNVFSSVIQDKIDVDKLAIFDIEYMFLQIRGKSVGETIDLLFQCDEDHGEQNEKAVSKVTLNIQELEVVKPEGHSNKIELFGKVGIIMRYPTLEVSDTLKDVDDVEEVFNLVAGLIDVIYDGDDVYYGHETKKEELLQFLNNLTSEQFAKIQKFFETMPKISTKVEYKCPICGKEHRKVLEGLQSFF